MSEIKFDYIFEYADTKKLFHKVFSLEDIENGKMVYSSNSCIAKRRYSGEKDKNGVEIYEGDIVYTNGYGNDIVVFKDGRFCIDGYSYPNNDINYNIVEVVGNIYDNKDK